MMPSEHSITGPMRRLIPKRQGLSSQCPNLILTEIENTTSDIPQ